VRVSAQEAAVGRKPSEPAQIANPLQQRAQVVLRSGELEGTLAYARSVLELVARDPEAAAAIARAAAAEGSQRAAALEEANLTIKTKSPPPRMAAPREAVVQEIADVVPAGKLIKIKFKRCKTSPDGTTTCTEVEIEI
jgi:hypothetical protein